MTALLASEFGKVGKATIDKSGHAELDDEDMEELGPTANKIAKLYAGKSQQIKTALVEGLGNTYGFTLARKEPLDDMIARMLGTLLLHGVDITAIPRYIELVQPPVKTPAETKKKKWCLCSKKH